MGSNKTETQRAGGWNALVLRWRYLAKELEGWPGNEGAVVALLRCSDELDDYSRRRKSSVQGQADRIAFGELLEEVVRSKYGPSTAGTKPSRSQVPSPEAK
jgi:hypothetical protein